MPDVEACPPAWCFTDLFDLAEIQHLQDTFAETHQVASIITDPTGRPLTRPSNFTRLCQDVIRACPAGLQNCMRSDALLGRPNPLGPVVQPCLSGGLWDGGASICVDDVHLANWLVGQVRNEEQDEASMLAYARQIGADEAVFQAALDEVPVMSRERFEQICRFLFEMADLISRQAVRSAQLQQALAARQLAEAERDRLERQLRLSANVEAMGRLAGGIAHDFGNLLTAIQGYAELLVADQPEPGDPQAPAARILAASGRAGDLVRRLLDFARQRPGRRQRLDLAALLGETAALLERTLPANIAIDLLLADGPVHCHGDGSDLLSALLNLGINAGQAMPAGGRLTLTLKIVPGDGSTCDRAQIEVGDTGLGMDEATQVRIFEPYFTTRGIEAGTGLGLTRVQTCIQEHAGSIEVQSEPGQGTVFTILLPLDQSVDQALDLTG